MSTTPARADAQSGRISGGSSAREVALSGFLPVRPVQMLAIIFSALIALLHTLARAFFNPGEIVKLFYVAGEFLEIRERAGKGKLHCGIKSNAELSLEYDELIEEYTMLRRAYIEYIRTPSYYRHKRRKLKALGGRFTELPPMKRKSGPVEFCDNSSRTLKAATIVNVSWRV